MGQHSKRYRSGAQPIDRDAPQKRAQTQSDCHNKQMLEQFWPVEALDIAEPWRRPQSLQRPGRPDASRRKWGQAPEAWVGVNRL